MRNHTSWRVHSRCALLSGVVGRGEQDKLVKTIVANYILWPVAHFINFRFVPSEQRIAYNNVVSVRPRCPPPPVPPLMNGKWCQSAFMPHAPSRYHVCRGRPYTKRA